MRLSDGRRSYAASCRMVHAEFGQNDHREYALHFEYVRFTSQTVNYRPGMIESGKKGLLKLGVQNRVASSILTSQLRHSFAIFYLGN